MTVTILKICNGVNDISDMANLGCERDKSLRRSLDIVAKKIKKKIGDSCPTKVPRTWHYSDYSSATENDKPGVILRTTQVEMGAGILKGR